MVVRPGHQFDGPESGLGGRRVGPDIAIDRRRAGVGDAGTGKDGEALGSPEVDRRGACGICHLPAGEHAHRESDRDTSRKQQLGTMDPSLHPAISLMRELSVRTRS
jgi:hypothetical protein